MRRRSVTLLLVAIAALAVTACGNKKARTLHAATEGIYLDIGPLKYQVQISRLLNPADPEDRGYLVDLPAGEALGPQDQWFAVFMRVQNETSKPQPAAGDYVITDTQGNRFQPIQMGPKNVFVYRAGNVAPKDTLPLPDSAAGQNTVQGAMLLFKIPVKDFENRPLVLSISTPTAPGQVGTVDLDV
jgi:hypothetical protein